MRLVVKVGSSTLSHATGKINLRFIDGLCRVLSDLKNAGNEVILVSSGAIAMGVSKLSLPCRPADIPTKQAAAAVGQCELMYTYDKFFGEYNQTVAQILLTAEDVENKERRNHFENTLEKLLGLGAVPVINENDTISVTELMFTDNDELSGMVASMMNADCLVILSNVDGIYNGNPDSPGSSVIKEIRPGDNVSGFIGTVKSSFGRGGMLTKYRIAAKVADEGIEVVIANGKKKDILQEILLHKSSDCTRFIPAERPISHIKKWIAHSDGFAKGKIRINEGAMLALAGEKASSLLPVGVTSVEGDFEKGDIVLILSPEGKTIGMGKVSMDSVRASECIGMKGRKPLIHYDYLYME